MEENSCLLCFEIFKNVVQDMDNYEYIDDIFQCCDRFLCENIKGDSFHRNCSSDNISPFCLRCYNSSKKLWLIENKLKEIGKELEDYIVTFTEEIIIFRTDSTKSTRDDNQTETGQYKEAVFGIPFSQSDPDDIEIQSQNSIPREMILVSPENNENDKAVVIEVFKEEPECSGDDDGGNDLEDLDFSSPIASPLADPDPPELISVPDEAVSKVSSGQNNEHHSKEIRVLLERLDSKYLQKDYCKNWQNGTYPELRVSLARLQFGAEGKAIIEQKSIKRKAAVAATASFLKSQPHDGKRFAMDRKGSTLKVDDLWNCSDEDQNDISDEDIEEISPVRRRKKIFQGSKSRGKECFQCGICNIIFKFAKHLEAHSKTTGHINERVFKCHLCPNKYFRNCDLRSHRKRHNFKSRDCNICGVFLETLHDYAVHGNIHRNEEKIKKGEKPWYSKPKLPAAPRFSCAVCQEDFNFAKNLDAHAEQTGHVTERLFICKRCPNKYYRKVDLKCHNFSHTYQSKDCEVCGKTCPTYSSYNFHIKTHDKEKKPKRKKEIEKFKCIVCSAMFQLSKELELHSEEAGHANVRNFQCNNCPKKYYRKEDLRSHNLTHTYTPKPCVICGRELATHGSYKFHMKRHRDLVQPKLTVKGKPGRKPSKMKVEKFECIVCSVEFKFARDLTLHAEKAGHANVRTYECTLCPKKYYRYCDLKGHRKSHKAKINPCSICGYICTSIQMQQRHVLKKHRDHDVVTTMGFEDHKYKCSICDRRFAREWDYNGHWNSHIGATPHKCEMENCHAAYGFKAQLIDHLRAHRMNYFQCSVCFEMFKNSLSLKYHVKTHADEMRTQCDSCVRTFAEKKHLIAHGIAEHGKESPFKCQFCDSTFNYNKDFAFHVKVKHPRDYEKVSEELKPYDCDKCGKMYSHRSSLRQHIQITHDNNERRKSEIKRRKKGIFTCEHCAQTFTTQNNLNMHINVRHLKVLSFICHICGKDLASASALRIHLRIHTDKTHDCPICGRGFSARCNLRRHMTHIHEQNKIPRKSFRKTPAATAKQPTNMEVAP